MSQELCFEQLKKENEELRLKLKSLIEKKDSKHFEEQLLESDTQVSTLQLTDIFDKNVLQELLNNFSEATGVASAILDINGKSILRANWKNLCLNFHRKDDKSCQNCLHSDSDLARQIAEGKKIVVSKCENGLFDAASPILIGGKHIAILYVGQFLDKQPDIEFFRKQAKKFGFDEDIYLKDLEDIPVVTEKKIKAFISFLSTFAAELGKFSTESIKSERLSSLLKQQNTELSNHHQSALGLLEDAEAARNQAEKARLALEISEDRYRLITQLTTDYIFKLNVSKDFKVELVYATENFSEITGRTLTDAKSVDSWANFILAEDMPILQGMLKQLLTTGTSGTIECRSKVFEKIRWVNVYSKALRNEEGRIDTIIGAVKDITDRKEAEIALRISESRFHTLFMDHNAVMLLIDPENSKIVDANNAAVNFYGYPVEKLKTMSADDINILSSTEIQEEMTRALNQNRQYFQFIHRLANGEKRDVEVYSSPINFLDRKIIFSIIHDITDRQRIEHELAIKTDELNGYFNHALDLLCIADNQGHFRRLNPLWGITLGYSLEEFMGQKFLDFVHPEDIEATLAVMKSLEDMKSVLNFVNRYRHKNGNYLWIEWRSYAVGESIYAVARDITERILAEQTLRESEEKFRSLFENITEGVALHEMVYNEDNQQIDYRIVAVNPAYQTHTGLTPEVAIGELGTVLYGTAYPPYLKEFGDVANTRIPFRFETYFQPMDKHFMISVVSPKEGQFATVFEDITDRKHREEELRQKNEELSRFIYTVSHDLKSPLVTIKSFTSYLIEDIENLDKEAQNKDIGYIQNAADKMGELLDELLELSRIGRKDNPKIKVSLQTIVASAVDMVAGQIKEKGVEIIVTEQPVMLVCDRQRMVQLFQNLIDNAVKFMGDQQAPKIEIGVQHIKKEDNKIVFFVRDNGSGIDPRYHHKIFGLFEKLDNHTGGTGIGLALVKRIVEVHEGKIWFESEGLRKGTTFYFTILKSTIANH